MKEYEPIKWSNKLEEHLLLSSELPHNFILIDIMEIFFKFALSGCQNITKCDEYTLVCQSVNNLLRYEYLLHQDREQANSFF